MTDFGFALEGLDAPPGTLGPKGLNTGKGSASPGPSSFQPYAEVRSGARTPFYTRPQNKSVPRAERTAERPSSSCQDANKVTPYPTVEQKWSRQTARKFRYSLKNVAGRILPKERVARCGHRLLGPQATVCMGKSGAYIAGVETCGSVWTCPVCAAKISEGRRIEVAQCLDGHVKAGGDVYMGLFTMPHHALETCAKLKGFVTRSWQKVLAGEPWKRAKMRFGIVGYVRALEITHGANGWHPHIHALFLTARLPDGEFKELQLWLGERWMAVVQRLAGKAVNLSIGYNLQKACSVSAAGDYVAKWGVDSEISKAHLKVSKRGGRSPWQLLTDAGGGDKRAEALFRSYALAMKGSRHLTWSRGLREQYVRRAVLSDEELAKLEMPHKGDIVIGLLDREIWGRICKSKLIPLLLSTAEDSGWIGVRKLLASKRLCYPARQETS